MANLNKIQRLTFIAAAGQDKAHNNLGLYRCECGNERIYPIKEVRNMRKTACGCRRAKEFNQWGKKHGLRSHPLYDIYRLIIYRTENTDSPDYENYGGRGIKMCNEWRESMQSFIDWGVAHGWQKGLQLDRRENDGDYTPVNCRFVTKKVNNNNRRNNRFLEFNGKRQTVQQWSEEIGIPSSVIRRRIDKYKYSVEAALSKPVKYK